MPNPTPLRAVRISDEIWTAAQSKAANEGLSVSEAIRAGLCAWVDGELTITREEIEEK